MKIRKLKRRKRVEWVLDYYEGKRRIRKFYKSKTEAGAAADDIKEQHKDAGQSWVAFSPQERADLMLVAAEARDKKLSVRQVWEAYKSGKLDAAPVQRCKLQDAIEATINWRRGENLRERYLLELESYLKKFGTGRMGMFIDQIGVAEIQEWFAGREEALSTKRANIGRLGSMFDVAWKQGYIKENPCLKLPTVKLRQEPPRIFTPKEARKVLRICRARMKLILPYITLGMFAGIRPEELEKLTWSDWKPKEGTITVDVAAAKTSRRRIVRVHPTVCEWMKICQAGKPAALIAPPKVTLRRYRRKVRNALKIQWPQDVLRHTAGSYLLALHKNAHEVAVMLGNSARILERHYKDLVNEKDCKAFWALIPQAVKKGGAK